MNPSQESFMNRFEQLQRRLRKTSGITIFAWALLAFTALITLLAVVDYYWELPRSIRIGVFGLGIVASMSFLVSSFFALSRRWSTQPTAAEIEQFYPELGQRVRTTVQYTTEDHRPDDGVAPTLVSALSTETEERMQPINVDQIVPVGRMWGAVGFASLALIGLSLSMQFGWEWKTALSRSFGSGTPYTTVKVGPGDVVVKEGETVPLQFDVTGRPREEVILLTRPVGQADAEWTEETLDRELATLTSERNWTYETEIPRLSAATEYRVVAGTTMSQVYRVDVRFPLKIQQVQTEIEYPNYTGLKSRTIADGNMTSLRGSTATVEIQLDRAPISAEVILNRVGRIPEGTDRSRSIPVQVQDRTVTVQLDIDHDFTWSLAALSPDGTELPKRVFRVRVQYDQFPRVGFQKPDEILEVHTLTEVLMKIRAADDYGLSRSGIVFQVNNGEEHLLLQEDFESAVESVAGAEEDGLSNQTRAMLEKVLPLEYFNLTQKDSIMYYAFAEDNSPTPQRTESDLRFIDIRPFRINYREADPDDGDGGGNDGPRGRSLTALSELIRRERFTLNRTIKLGRRSKNWGSRDLNTIDQLIEYQAEIGALTRELAEGLSRFGITQEVETLFQAESSMLAAVDSLSLGNFDPAALQEKDAQQYLVEARNRLTILLRNNPQLRRAISGTNTRIRRRLRGQGGDGESSGRSLIYQLQQLAGNQSQTSSMARSLANSMIGNPNPPLTEEPTDSKPDETEQTEESDSDDPVEDSQEPSVDINLAELRERQFDAVAEAEDLLKTVDSATSLTDLVKSRMKAATAQADQAAGSLSRGETRKASEQAAESSEQFRELALLVEALVAEEVSQRVSTARRLTAQLADQERAILEKMQKLGQGGQAANETDNSMLEAMAQQLGERAETIADVMTAFSNLNDPDAGDVADRVADIAEQQKVFETLGRVQAIAQQFQSQEPQDPDLQAEIKDTKERLQLTVGDLDRLFRSMVMPRLAQLRELEERVAKANKSIQNQESLADIDDFTRDLQELIRDLENAKGGAEAQNELYELVEAQKFPRAESWETRQETAGYMGPPLLRTKFAQIGTELRRQIQEIILMDIIADTDEATPPGYQHLVEKYLQVLSASE